VKHRVWVGVLFSGVLFGLSVSGFDLSLLAWICLVPALVSASSLAPKGVFARGLAAGFLAGIILWYQLWTGLVKMTGSTVISALFTSCLCAFFAVWFAAALVVMRLAAGIVPGRTDRLWHVPMRCVLGGAAWVGAELVYTRLFILAGLPFVPTLGYSQWAHPAVIQVAALTGVYGISFVIVVANVAVGSAIASRRMRPLLIPLLAVCSVILCGMARLRFAPDPEPSRTLRAAALQGDIGPFEKMDPAALNRIGGRYVALCGDAAEAGSRLVVWSETAVPWRVIDEDALITEVLRTTASAQSVHVVGAAMKAPNIPGRVLNAALLVHPDGLISAMYAKMRIIPFAERPLRIPGLLPSGMSHPSRTPLAPGQGLDPIHAPFGLLGVNICNETFFPSHVRRGVANGAELIVHLANTGWFRWRNMLRRHLRCNVLRAVETGRDSVVANNSGISAIVDAYGRVRAEAPPFTPVCLTGTVSLRSRRTVYVRFGDGFAVGCLGLTGLALVAHWVRRRRVA